MTWGIYKKKKQLRGGGIGTDLFQDMLNLIAVPVGVIGQTIGNLIKPGAGDDFKMGYDSVIEEVVLQDRIMEVY